jgi:hypothetical protein
MSRMPWIVSFATLVVTGLAAAQGDCLDRSFLQGPQTNGLELSLGS